MEEIKRDSEVEIHLLQKENRTFRELADAVQSAHVIDLNIYAGMDTKGWLAIDREDYARMIEILSRLDLWRPWNCTVQRRIRK